MGAPCVTRRGWLRGVGAALLPLGGAACDGGSALPVPASRTVVLRVAVPSGGAADAINEAVGEAVDRALPKVNGAAGGRYALEALDVPQPTAAAAGQAAPPLSASYGPLLASATAPDLLVFSQVTNVGVVPTQFALYATPPAALLPLDDHIKADKALTIGDFYAPALDVCRNKGRLMGVPLMAIPLLLSYDARRFDQAGVARPSAGWDWRRFMEAARRLTRDTDGDGAPDEYGFWSGFSTAAAVSLIWQNGGDVLSPDKKTALLTEPAAVEALEFYADLYRERVSPPTDVTSRQPVGPEGIRYAGRWWLGMMFQPEWRYAGAPGISVTELPQGKQKASLLAVPVILSAWAKGREPERSAAALAALTERVTKDIAPPPRRLPAAALTQIEPTMAPAVAEAVLAGLAASRSLALEDIQRTNALFDSLNRGLTPPLHRGAQSGGQVAASVSQTVRQLLSQG